MARSRLPGFAEAVCAPVDLGAAIGDRTARYQAWVDFDEADCDGGNIGCFCRIFAAADTSRRRRRRRRGCGSRRHASQPLSRMCPRSAGDGCAACRSIGRSMGTRRLSALQSRPQRGARLHRDLCAGIPAERHGDHPAHELLLAARLVLCLRRLRRLGPAPITAALTFGLDDRTAMPRVETASTTCPDVGEGIAMQRHCELAPLPMPRCSPAERANALSLSNPGAAAAVQEDTGWRRRKCIGAPPPSSSHHHRWHRWHHHHCHHHRHWHRW